MPRPKKWRKICCLPNNDRFGALNVSSKPQDIVNMTIDEYETIRLIDLEGLTQEECSVQMDISRSTIQNIYNEARKKIAETLVNSKLLLIGGGEYKLCDGKSVNCKNKICHKHSCDDKSCKKCTT